MSALFARRDSCFSSERARYSFLTNYTRWPERTQKRMYDCLYRYFKFMNKSKRYNDQHQGNPIQAPTVLPEEHAVAIIKKLGVTTHLQVSWGRKILQSFTVWKWRERHERAAAAAAALAAATPTAATPTSPVTTAKNKLRKKRRRAVKIAVADMRPTASSAAKKTKATAAAQAVMHPSYDASTGKFNCDIQTCRREFDSVQGLNSHTCKTVTKPGFYECSNCCILIQGSIAHQMHENSCNDPTPPSHVEKCDFCRKTGQAFVFDQSMADHCNSFDENHPKEDTSVCDKCNKYINNSSRHRCSGASLDTTALWVCVLCQLNTRKKHLFTTNQELMTHQHRYHQEE